MEQNIKKNNFVFKFLIIAFFAFIIMTAAILSGCDSAGPTPPSSSACISSEQQ